MTAAGATPRRRTLLFFVTEDWYFVSHRLPLAAAARAAGYDVVVVTRLQDAGDTIRAAGVRVVDFPHRRNGLNPLTELPTLLRLIALYRRERPDIVHHVAMKPVLYGTIAARLGTRARIVNALAGMGWLFTSGHGRAQRLKRLMRTALRHALRRGIVVVQNPDDERLVAELGVPPRQIRCIAGSGVDLDHFVPHAEAAGPPSVVLCARLLWDKGVGEFIAAARDIRARGLTARFVLVGEPDPDNPASIPPEQVTAWVDEGIVDNPGWVNDVATVLRSAHIACLPSYREGLPKALLEAAAAGLPIVTTDVPGCREVVRDGDNGLVVPPRDATALADALARLIVDAPLRRRLGARGRQRAESEFGVGASVARTLALYAELPA